MEEDEGDGEAVVAEIRWIKRRIKAKKLIDKPQHMGLELQNSFKEVARVDQCGKLTVRH